MTKTLFAALLATAIASPALGQDAAKEALGKALALTKIAPTLCGTSSSEIAQFTARVKLFALAKDWTMEEMERAGDGFAAAVGAYSAVLQDDICKSVESFIKMRLPIGHGQSRPTVSRGNTAGPPITEIKTGCRREWPSDYAMQEWCIKRQIAAWQKVEGY